MKHLRVGDLTRCPYVYQEITAVTRFPFHKIDFIASSINSFYSFIAAITFSVCAGGLHNKATPLVLTQVLSSPEHNVCDRHKVENGYYRMFEKCINFIFQVKFARTMRVLEA